MENGGHIKGYKLNNDSMTKVEEGLEALCDKEYFEKKYNVKIYYHNINNEINKQNLINVEEKKYEIEDFKFEFKKIGSSGGALFDLDKLMNISKNYLSKLTKDEIYDRVLNYSKEFDRKN